MQHIGPRHIAEEIIENLPFDASPMKLEDAIINIIENHSNWGIDPYESEKRWNKAIKEHLINLYEDCLNSGRQPKFRFNSSSPTMVQGPCFIEPGVDSDEIKEQKRKRFHCVSYFDSIKKITPTQFEVLGKNILRLLGVKSPKVTRMTGDEGIDFYGRLSLADLIGHGPLYPIFESSLNVWLIGQAKHYQKFKVATPDIRDLVGALNLGRARAFGGKDDEKYKDLSIRVCDPVFLLFFYQR